MPNPRVMSKPLDLVPGRRPTVLGHRFRIERSLEDGRFEAVDTTKGANVVATRVRFGPDRRAERDLLIERVRALWTVTAPALVLPIDAGEWDDDAYVIEETVDAPFTSLASGIEKLDRYERVSVARNVTEAIAALHAAGFVHGGLSLQAILIDGYRQPKIHTATIAVRASNESERVEDRTLRIMLDEIAPGALTPTRDDATAADLLRSIGHVEPSPSPPFVPVAGSAKGWRGLTVLAILLTLGAFIAIGWLFGQR